MEINQPQILRIFPSEVNFNSIQVDTEYICSISVQNTDLVPHKIRLGCPTNRNFKINKTCTIIIASGLEFKFDLYFKCSKLQDYHDTVKISMEDEIFEVPIHAYIPKPVLLVDSFLDFGSIIVGSNVTKYLEIVNEGEIEGSYNFTHDKGLPIEVKPMKGVLQAKTLISGDTSNKIRIEIKFSANNVGIFRESLILHSSDSTDRIIDLNATVVDRKVDFLLLPERSIVTELDYGTLFYNKRKVLSTVLINNSPQPLSYNIIYNYDPNDDVSVHSSTSMNVNEKPVKISSTTGIIAPYDEMKIDFTLFVLLPKLPIKGRLTTEPVEITQLNENIVIELLDSNQTLSFSILADLVRPLVSISKQFVNFENCNTSDRRDETITITNKCTKLPIKWETTTIAQFKISPPNGILHPSQSQNIIVSFVPQQLGVFKDLIQFVFERGIVVIPLRLQGECEVVGQKLKYSQVLNQEPKFIMSVEKDIKPQFSRQEPWEEYPSQSMIIEEENIASSYTFGISDQIKMKEFKQKYNSFIRPNKTIPKSPKIDLNDINLGMKPYEGLKEPELEIPKKVDKLWLKKPINEIIKPKTNLSISKVEPKKYKSTPSSPAEAAACQMKLSDEELINIQAGPLLIQFNTMTVNSKITKIFTVFNDLQQCIMASIDIKQEELKETNPLVQIIPPGKMGKFDMTFSSSKEVQFEESIYFTINGNHKMKLKVLAMVVPLYLNISRDTIKFNFPDDNLEKSMTEVFTMVNPGTIEAEYIWSTQENDPYQIIPKNGVIRVGETVTFQIKFTPFYRCLTDMIFKCMINNGKTTVLRCIAGSLGGVLKVPEKPTILGLIPVGLPTVVDVKIQNTSNVTVVFYASCDLPEILINNKKCRIEVLEYFTLSITFLPQKEFIYTEENAIINISTRGGLDYKLSFTAESKIPKIEIVEDEYNFGTVIIGSQTKKGITVEI